MTARRAFGPPLRALFCVLLLTSALGKLLDNRGFAAVIGTYQFSIPEPLLLPLGLVVSLVELALGLAILMGFRLRSAAQLTVAAHLGYLSLAVITNLRGIALVNCGCFGVFLARPMTWYTVLEDAILVLLALGFLWTVSPRASPARSSDQSAVTA
jgi:uncharacterized membrane protein YphA (DoxX/SURF4 family)